MPARMNYYKTLPEGMARMTELEHWLNAGSGLEPVLLALVRLRASQMNGCEYCIRLHTEELKRLNEPSARIDGLAKWQWSGSYSERERAALGWTEAVTNIQEGHAPDESYEALKQHITDAEIAGLTLAITTINAWNRLAISLGDYPGHAGSTGAAGSVSR